MNFWEQLSKNKKFKIKSFRDTKQNNIFANWNPYLRGLTYQNFLIYQFVNNNIKDFINFKKKINNLDIGNPPSVNFNNKYKISIDDCLSFEEIFFLKKYIPKKLNKKIKVIEIGGGYGRTCEAFIKSFKIDNYTIIDYKNISSLSTKYLKKVLTTKEYKKISFVYFEKFNFKKDYFGEEVFDLLVNIDSFHEMENKIIYKYLNYFKKINNFYIKNSVNKYQPKDMVNHLKNLNPPPSILKLGLNRDVINIFDNKQLEKSKKAYIKNYNPFNENLHCYSEFSKLFNFYLHALFIKEK